MAVAVSKEWKATSVVIAMMDEEKILAAVDNQPGLTNRPCSFAKQGDWLPVFLTIHSDLPAVY
jgi:hypothetical protein